MSSVFDDIAAIAKAQNDAYHTAYACGYAEGYRVAMLDARKMIVKAFEQPSEKK